MALICKISDQEEHGREPGDSQKNKEATPRPPRETEPIEGHKLDAQGEDFAHPPARYVVDKLAYEHCEADKKPSPFTRALSHSHLRTSAATARPASGAL